MEVSQCKNHWHFQCGWGEININKNDGKLTMEEIATQEDTCIETKPQRANNNIQMHQCIMNTLTKEGQ